MGASKYHSGRRIARGAAVFGWFCIVGSGLAVLLGLRFIVMWFLGPLRGGTLDIGFPIAVCILALGFAMVLVAHVARAVFDVAERAQATPDQV